MYRYAQINIITCIVESVSVLAGKSEKINMIPLSDTDNVRPGDRYENGTWVPAVPNAPALSTTEQDIAAIMLALAESQIKQQQTDETVAELMLMMAGGQVNV